jgi:hypothetical protein
VIIGYMQIIVLHVLEWILAFHIFFMCFFVEIIHYKLILAFIYVYRHERAGNEQFVTETSKWVFHERGHLKVYVALLRKLPHLIFLIGLMFCK